MTSSDLFRPCQAISRWIRAVVPAPIALSTSKCQPRRRYPTRFHWPGHHQTRRCFHAVVWAVGLSLFCCLGLAAWHDLAAAVSPTAGTLRLSRILASRSGPVWALASLCLGALQWLFAEREAARTRADLSSALKAASRGQAPNCVLQQLLLLQIQHQCGRLDFACAEKAATATAARSLLLGRSQVGLGLAVQYVTRSVWAAVWWYLDWGRTAPGFLCQLGLAGHQPPAYLLVSRADRAQRRLLKLRRLRSDNAQPHPSPPPQL